MSKDYFFIFLSGSSVLSGSIASGGVKCWT
jgi:hypothetical protein